MALKAYAGGRLFAHVHGEGPPDVVALHGWARSGADFDRTLAGLSALAFDLPGFGASAPPPRRCGALGYAEMLVPALADNERPPVLVGHSFGGRVAVKLAALIDVAGLILTGVPLVRGGPTRRPSASFRLARLANRVGVLGDERMEELRRSRGSADYRAATGVMRDVLVTVVGETYEAELAALAVPVHLVWGSEDREVPPSVAERADALVQHGHLTVLPGIGHHVPLEAPAALRAAIETMIRQ